VFAASAARIRRAAQALGVDLLEARHQLGPDFGARLTHAIEDAQAQGYDAIVVVPQDAPAITARTIGQAFTALESRDLVLGPARDGGVYLIGVKGSIDGRFDRVRWQTAGVLADLMASSASTALLEPLDEIDTRQDLARFLRAAKIGAFDVELTWLFASLSAIPTIAAESSPRARPQLAIEPIRGPPAA
jgi:glycosyltransferase A (GT-A) superfamily protein (DUF2064 family)